MNAINVIHPYKDAGQWVFDDPSRELKKEALVSGADTLLDVLTISGVSCSVVFSEKPFPTSQEVLENISPEVDGQEGTFYYHQKSGIKAWLCPALLKYFSTPPTQIHFQINLIKGS